MVKLGVVHWLENQKALVQHWGPAKDLKMFTVTIGCIGENVFPIWGEMLLHFIYLFIAHLFHSLILFFSITTVDGSSLRNTTGRVLLTNLTVTQLSELCYNHDKGWGCLSVFSLVFEFIFRLYSHVVQIGMQHTSITPTLTFLKQIPNCFLDIT